MEHQDLLDLKEKIDLSKDEINRLNGQKDLLMQQLKKDWKCNTLVQAQKKIKEMETELDTLETAIDTGVTKLKKEYDV